jgi:hypothetical protein
MNKNTNRNKKRNTNRNRNRNKKKGSESRTGTELEKVSSVSLVSNVNKLIICRFTDGCISVFLGNISAFLEVIRWVAPKNANTNGSFP